PPSYKIYHGRERRLPQHNLSLPYPDGSHAKFLWADNPRSNAGWGDYMQDILLNAYIAYAAKRAYVFDNYTWERDGPESEISSWNGRPMPSRIPLSAFISGPIIGGPMRDKDVPRAVSREYHLSVCPESERVVLDTRRIQDTLDAGATINQIVDGWVAELRSIQAPCVQLTRSSPSVRTLTNTNIERVLDVFPALAGSPILSDFGWSLLVLGGFYDNIKHFVSQPSMMESSAAPLRGLLALNIRGADETRCTDAYVKYSRVNAPTIDRLETYDASELTFMHKYCLPSIAEIVDKVRAINAPHMSRVYVMTDAPLPWLAELKAALRAAHTWAGVTTSRDLRLSREATFIAEAVDMYVAQRAERFIGDGVSSLTSNIVLLRMQNTHLRPSDTHVW
ncbi:hypothetical protein K438DRAFT_1460844, partial [Mycena galopus ATCC 62051]